MTASSTVLVKDVNHVRWIYFNRPEKLNALTHDDIKEATVRIQEACDSMAAIVFSGVGERAFSAGVHLQTFADLSVQGARQFISDLKTLIQTARQAPIPTIAAINGYCIGGAMELAMACDIRIAVRQAKFGMPEIKVGIPSVLDAALLQQHIGLSKAKEMLLTGELYDAQELDKYGFLNQIVEAGELEQAVQRMLERVAIHTKSAVASQKRLFEVWQNTGLQESINASVNEFALVFGDEETHKRIAHYQQAFKK